VSLVELSVPQREPRAVRAADRVLAWLTGTAHRRAIHAIDGLVPPWRAPGGKTGPPDVVDWGRSGRNMMVTLNALRVLAAAGRLA
jgi:hypothetical protein